MFLPGGIPVGTSPPDKDAHYIRDDCNKSFKPEQRQLWEDNYPVGQLLPISGTGFTAGELTERVRWYCKTTGVRLVSGIDEILGKLRDAGLVKVVKEKKE